MSNIHMYAVCPIYWPQACIGSLEHEISTAEYFLLLDIHICFLCVLVGTRVKASMQASLPWSLAPRGAVGAHHDGLPHLHSCRLCAVACVSAKDSPVHSAMSIHLFFDCLRLFPVVLENIVTGPLLPLNNRSLIPVATGTHALPETELEHTRISTVISTRSILV